MAQAVGNVVGEVGRARAAIAASQTDTALVAAVPGKIIRVLSFIVQAGGVATTVTFRSKPSGAGSDISMQFQNGANGGVAATHNDNGWFETNSGEGLSVSTGAGSTTGVQIVYAVI